MACSSAQATLQRRSVIWVIMAIRKFARRSRMPWCGFARRARRPGFWRRSKTTRGIGWRKGARWSPWAVTLDCWPAPVKPWRRNSRVDLLTNQPSLVVRKGFPTSRGQLIQRKIANLHSNQAQRRMADGRSHAAHLPVFPFDQFQSNPAIRNVLAKPNWRIAWRRLGLRLQKTGATRQSLSSLNLDPFFQFPQRLGGWDPLDLRPINAAMALPRVQQAFVQFRFIT